MSSGQKTTSRKTLTGKQQRFVDEYMVDLHATNAAIRAGYSPKTASVQASQMMAKPYIKKHIDAKMAKHEEKTEVDRKHALRVLKDAIDRLSDGKNENALARFLALEMKHLGMLIEKHELQGRDGGPLRLQVNPDDLSTEHLEIINEILSKYMK